jgi:hypothetical protein
MGIQPQRSIEQARQRVIREYRRQGYEIIDPATSGVVPESLRQFHPDVVAVKDDDRVVVELKPARTLKGSNELNEFAVRAREEGWRLELLTVGDGQRAPLSLPDSDRLAALTERSSSAFAKKLPDVAYVYAVALSEELLRDLAAQNGTDARQFSGPALAQELAEQGVLSEAMVKSLRGAWEWRNRFVHGRTPAPPPGRSELDRVLKVCRSLHSLLRLEAAE